MPEPIARLYGLPERTVERALGIANLDLLFRARASGDVSVEGSSELGYKTHPFEVVPFAWQGGDGLQYGLLLHDPALGAKSPLVSYAPVDDGGPCWLGDDASQGIANLMGVALRDSGHYYEDPEERKEAENATGKAVRTVARAIRVAPAKDVRAFTRGARTKRKPAPKVPAGSRWVETLNAMGVLAPKAMFDPTVRHKPDPRAEPDASLGQALRLLTRGFPASALAVARNVYAGYSAYQAGVDTAAATVMRDAYAALGRPFLAARAAAYLTEQAAQDLAAAAKKRRK
jgi:hypothetical protein